MPSLKEGLEEFKTIFDAGVFLSACLGMPWRVCIARRSSLKNFWYRVCRGESGRLGAELRCTSVCSVRIMSQ